MEFATFVTAENRREAFSKGLSKIGYAMDKYFYDKSLGYSTTSEILDNFSVKYTKTGGRALTSKTAIRDAKATEKYVKVLDGGMTKRTIRTTEEETRTANRLQNKYTLGRATYFSGLGKKSAKARFKGKTKEEISREMSALAKRRKYKKKKIAPAKKRTPAKKRKREVNKK